MLKLGVFTHYLVIIVAVILNLYVQILLRINRGQWLTKQNQRKSAFESKTGKLEETFYSTGKIIVLCFRN